MAAGREPSPAPACSCSNCEEQKMAEKTFKAGDKVEWDSSGGHSVGKVVKKLTSECTIKGHTVKASKDNPEYLVQSDKSGKKAAHKPEALNKAK
jgi:plastocyanin